MSLLDPFVAFQEAAAQKEQRGIVEHRNGDSSRPFSGDVLEEYADEQLDSVNYLTKMLTDRIISNEEFRLAASRHLDCWSWIMENVKKREC